MVVRTSINIVNWQFYDKLSNQKQWEAKPLSPVYSIFHSIISHTISQKNKTYTVVIFILTFWLQIEMKQN